MSADADYLLRAPTNEDFPTLTRANAAYHSLSTYELPRGEQKHYQQQYGDIYFLRLAKLKPVVEEIAAEIWEGYQIAGDTVHRVERVLDVRQGELCWVTGTVYMDMPLKPNILDDISKDHWIAIPPPRQKYLSPDGQDHVMLEDESGRLRLTGSFLESVTLVTGCIVAIMGTENSDGDFQVIDIKLPDLPPQPERWVLGTRSDTNVDKSNKEERPPSTKVAIVSGLEFSGESGDMLALDMLVEWLLGESTSGTTQSDVSHICRLIVAGNSLFSSTASLENDDSTTLTNRKSAKKYGYDSAAYNPAPTSQLDLFLSSLLPSLPITLLPGASDPANVSLPQQPLHAALFPHSRAYASPPTQSTTTSTQEPGWFHPTTNPAAFSIAGQRFLGTAGQPIDDIFKYVSGEDRLDMMAHTLRWRLVAPTCPDTLWCYPYQTTDPFVLEECPHVYFVGNQPEFGTDIIEGPERQRVRLIAVPKFRETGQVVVLDLETLEVEIVRFEVFESG